MSYISFRNIAAVVQVEQVSAVGDMKCVARFFRVELEYTLVFVKYDRHNFSVLLIFRGYGQFPYTINITYFTAFLNPFK